jgi:hypothetical protein
MKHLVIVLLVASACIVGNNSNVGVIAGERCEGAGSAYAQCAADVAADRDDCYGGCVNDATKCAVDTAIGFITNQLPCAGPVLESLLTSCAFCGKESGNELLACATSCVAGVFDEYFRDFERFKADIAQCAAGTSDQVLSSLKANFMEGLLQALASGAGCALAFGVCTSADTTLGIELGSCDTLYVAGLDACDTAQCNPAFCTCFDAQECPTIGGGAATTHMTGVVACDSISVGRATTAQGTQVSCISFTNTAEPEDCRETGWNPDGSFGGRGRFEACDSDAHCGEADGMALSCMDYDCDGRRHCDFSELGGPGNCCEANGPRDVGCQAGYMCVSPDGEAPRTCVKEPDAPSGPGSGG